jgi:ankyrin repeat protein
LSKSDDDQRAAFMRAAVWHGPLAPADAMLAADPSLATVDIHTAAIVADDEAVRRFLAGDRARATATSGPYDAEPLVYLCLSKYLRLDPSRTDRFLRAATALLDAGANPNAGFWLNGEFETAMYGAAGVAHHAAMTKLLLERGGDPNDVEVAYHSPETRDPAVLTLLVETGRLTPESLHLMVLRKIDWHDLNGIRYLLEHGAATSLKGSPRGTALNQALIRGNCLEIVELLLDHGDDPAIVTKGITAFARAAREGRGDVLDLFARRGIAIDLQGVDRLIAACASGDAAQVQSIAAREPSLVAELKAIGGELLARFSGTGNLPGVGQLLDAGVEVTAPFEKGDGYWGAPPGSLAIHTAAWRARHDVVKLLLDRGSPADVKDARGRTPLMLAVQACVDSYWTGMRSPASVDALLRAGASVDGVPFPSGYADVDALLARAKEQQGSQ